MNETDMQTIYVPDICRKVLTRYQKDVVWHGIRLRRFNLTIENFQSSSENPANACYDHVFKQPSGEFQSQTEIGTQISWHLILLKFTQRTLGKFSD